MDKKREDEDLAAPAAAAAAEPEPAPAPPSEAEAAAPHKCPAGHRLLGAHVPRQGGMCDVCRVRVRQGTLLYGCRPCNYDECEKCYNYQDTPDRKAQEAEREERNARGALDIAKAHKDGLTIAILLLGCFLILFSGFTLFGVIAASKTAVTSTLASSLTLMSVLMPNFLKTKENVKEAEAQHGRTVERRDAAVAVAAAAAEKAQAEVDAGGD